MMELDIMFAKCEIIRDDIFDMETYGVNCKECRAEVVVWKKNCCVDVGFYAMAYFECYAIMWHQVHEMLFIEWGGEEQIDDELWVYNLMIPNGRELVITIMFEIDDLVRCKMVLLKIGGIEETVFLKFAGEIIIGEPETDLDCIIVDGKVSFVQFVYFFFTDAQAVKFCESGMEVIFGFFYFEYAYMIMLFEAVRAEFAGDFAQNGVKNGLMLSLLKYEVVVFVLR